MSPKHAGTERAALPLVAPNVHHQRSHSHVGAGCTGHTCAMLRMCRISAKLGGTYLRRLSAKNSSYSWNASTSRSGVKKLPVLGTMRRCSRDRRVSGVGP